MAWVDITERVTRELEEEARPKIKPPVPSEIEALNATARNWTQSRLIERERDTGVSFSALRTKYQQVDQATAPVRRNINRLLRLAEIKDEREREEEQTRYGGYVNPATAEYARRLQTADPSLVLPRRSRALHHARKVDR